jgi:hypothetical protein
MSPEMGTSNVGDIWGPKNPDFQGPPFPMAQVMDFPPSKYSTLVFNPYKKICKTRKL